MIKISISNSFIILKKIRIINYKTYLNLEIPFNNSITTLVGPNECGKTNLLESINFLGISQELTKNDTCLYCESYWDEEPNFIYSLDLRLLGLADIPTDSEISIKPDHVELLSPPDMKSNIKIINKHRLSFPLGRGGHVHVKIPPELKSKYSLSDMVTIQEGKYFDLNELSENELLLLNNLNKSTNLYENISIDIVKLPELKQNNEDKLLNQALKRIKIIYWAFDESKFIQDIVDINALNQDPQLYKYILNMLKITDIDLNHFLQASDIRRINMINQINDKISDLIKSSWKQYDLEFNLSLGRNNNLITTFRESGQNIEPGKRSEGFKWYFSFLLDFNAKFGSDIKNCLILLDEPGIHLHPGGQRMLLKQLEELSMNNQIIYTTHLPFMINRMFPNRIIYLNKVNGKTELKTPRKEGIFDDILLSSTLGFEFTSLSNWGEINVFVEGITDKILIKKIALEKANKDKEIILDLNEFSLISLNGVHNLENFIRVAQETDAKYIAFLDNDKESKKYTKKYEKKPKNHPETIEHMIFLDENKTIEDYIPINLLNDALNNLKSLENIPYSKYINELEFENNSIVNQIKKFTDRINKAIEENQSNSILNTNKEYITEKITSQDLKLELIIQVKELISSENIDQFNDLINHLKKITEKTKQLFKI
ncbi:hypothetical protein LCGC14_1630170 [marine sediment metagenome]|uniref:Uncharacterized protein n=1 Tax=marine sediment metagenome TaxID=412755 RepID=A0A0F9KIG6_9ZZZZ